MNANDTPRRHKLSAFQAAVLLVLCVLMVIPPEAYALAQVPGEMVPTGDNSPTQEVMDMKIEVPVDSVATEPQNVAYQDTIMTVVTADDYVLDGKRPFNPMPERAVWLSALFPGLGQIYNRRYWKLPIVVGGFMGLGYATSWNNNQFQDYTQAYRDLLDSDPDTKSYMNFFPPTTKEEDLDKTWLTSLMKSRKDFYRRNRDLCIIGVVLLYLVCMVDAYVDASLAHFDISPNLSMDVQPAMFMSPGGGDIQLGMNWAFNF